MNGRLMLVSGVLGLGLVTGGRLAGADVPGGDLAPSLPGTVARVPAPFLPAGYRLLYEQPCTNAASLADFVFSDPAAWCWTNTTDGGALELFGKSRYNPKDRSPFNIALVAGRAFGDFTLDVEMQSTVKPYGHQDMCVFYGFEATNRFYYTHLAVAADPHAHNIFVVDQAPRKAVARETTKGITWGDQVWHLVRIERRLADGTIKVYFDDLTKPLMVASDRSFGVGHLGFGSFDDKGRIRNIRVYGPSAQERPFTAFGRQVAP